MTVSINVPTKEDKVMKKLLILITCILAFATTDALAQRVHVRGSYHRRTGTYVAPHYRTSPDHSRTNNWSSRGNSNPYTGKSGSRDPYRSYFRRKY